MATILEDERRKNNGLTPNPSPEGEGDVANASEDKGQLSNTDNSVTVGSTMPTGSTEQNVNNAMPSQNTEQPKELSNTDNLSANDLTQPKDLSQVDNSTLNKGEQDVQEEVNPFAESSYEDVAAEFERLTTRSLLLGGKDADGKIYAVLPDEELKRWKNAKARMDELEDYWKDWVENHKARDINGVKVGDMTPEALKSIAEQDPAEYASKGKTIEERAMYLCEWDTAVKEFNRRVAQYNASGFTAPKAAEATEAAAKNESLPGDWKEFANAHPGEKMGERIGEAVRMRPDVYDEWVNWGNANNESDIKAELQSAMGGIKEVRGHEGNWVTSWKNDVLAKIAALSAVLEAKGKGGKANTVAENEWEAVMAANPEAAKIAEEYRNGTRPIITSGRNVFSELTKDSKDPVNLLVTDVIADIDRQETEIRAERAKTRPRYEKGSDGRMYFYDPSTGKRELITNAPSSETRFAARELGYEERTEVEVLSVQRFSEALGEAFNNMSQADKDRLLGYMAYRARVPGRTLSYDEVWDMVVNGAYSLLHERLKERYALPSNAQGYINNFFNAIGLVQLVQAGEMYGSGNTDPYNPYAIKAEVQAEFNKNHQFGAAISSGLGVVADMFMFGFTPAELLAKAPTFVTTKGLTWVMTGSIRPAAERVVMRTLTGRAVTAVVGGASTMFIYTAYRSPLEQKVTYGYVLWHDKIDPETGQVQEGVWSQAGQSALAGGSAGVFGGVIGYYTRNLTGKVAVYTAEVAKVAVEAGAFLAPEVFSGKGLTWEDYGHSVGMVLASKAGNFQGWKADVQRRAEGKLRYMKKDIVLNKITDEEMRSLEAKGYGNVAKLLRGKDLRSVDYNEAAKEYEKMKTDTNVTNKELRGATFIIDGTMQAPPMVVGYKSENLGNGQYRITPICSDGRKVDEAGIVCKGTENRNKVIAAINRDATINKANLAYNEVNEMAGTVATDKAVRAAMVDMNEKLSGYDKWSYAGINRAYQGAKEKQMQGVPITPAEKTIVEAVESRFEQPKEVDEAVAEVEKLHGVKIADVLKKDPDKLEPKDLDAIADFSETIKSLKEKFEGDMKVSQAESEADVESKKEAVKAAVEEEVPEPQPMPGEPKQKEEVQKEEPPKEEKEQEPKQEEPAKKPAEESKPTKETPKPTEEKPKQEEPKEEQKPVEEQKKPEATEPTEQKPKEGDVMEDPEVKAAIARLNDPNASEFEKRRSREVLKGKGIDPESLTPNPSPEGEGKPTETPKPAETPTEEAKPFDLDSYEAPGEKADMGDAIGIYGGKKADRERLESMDESETHLLLAGLERERKQAHAYAEGLTDEKPRHYDYWKEKDGLDESKREGLTTSPSQEGEGKSLTPNPSPEERGATGAIGEPQPKSAEGTEATEEATTPSQQTEQKPAEEPAETAGTQSKPAEEPKPAETTVATGTEQQSLEQEQPSEQPQRVPGVVSPEDLEREKKEAASQELNKLIDQARKAGIAVDGEPWFDKKDEAAAAIVEEAAKKLGLNIETYDGAVDENGYYLNGTIYVNNNKPAESRLAFVLGHELTHGMDAKTTDSSPGVYQRFKSSAIKYLKAINGEEGYNNMLAEKRKEYETMRPKEMQASYEEALEKNPGLSYDEWADSYIADELAANVAGIILTDPKAARRVFSSITDKTMLQQMRTAVLDFIDNLLAKFPTVSESYKALQNVRNDLSEMFDSLYREREVADGLDETMSNTSIEGTKNKRLSTSANAEGCGFEVFETETIVDEEGNEQTVKKPIIDEEGNVCFRMGGKTFNVHNKVKASDLKGNTNSVLNYMMKDALRYGTMKPGQAEKIYRKYADMMNAYLEAGAGKNGESGFGDLEKTWLWVGETVFRTIASNSDAQYAFSMDITRVCKKNAAVIKSISELQVKCGYGITPAQILDVYLKAEDAGYQVPCPVCYVFSRYITNGQFMTSMVSAMRRFGDYMPGGKDPKPVEWWVGKLNELKKERSANSNRLKNAKEEVKINLQEIDKLTKLITSGKLTAKESATAVRLVEKYDARYRAALDLVSQESLDRFILTFVLEEHGKGENVTYTMREDARKPEDMEDFVRHALDIRLTASAASKYPAIGRYNRKGGASAGKEISFESNNELGEIAMGLGRGDLKEYPNWYKMAVEATDPKEREKYLQKASDRFKGAAKYVQRQTLRGGQRMWSWSDNIESLAPDVASNLMQLEMLGGALQTYSKQLEGVELVAAMNGYVNASLMGYGNGWKEIAPEGVIESNGELFLKEDLYDIDSKGRKRLLAKAGSPIYTENGKHYTLAFDDIVGIAAYGQNGKKGLFDLNEEYDRAGNILVGMNDIHVRAAMADKRIFFIIPWHASGMSNHILTQMMNALGIRTGDFKGTDYTNMQEEHDHLEKKDDGTYKHKVTSGVLEIWNTHTFEKEFDCGLGHIENGNGKGFLSAGQLKYRALRDAIFDGKFDELPEADKQAILNDEFLKQAYKMVRDGVVDSGLLGDKEGWMTSKDKGYIYPYEYWDVKSKYGNADINGKRYVEYCRRLGFTPKFAGEIKKDGTRDVSAGNFIDDPGYWKLLIDRRMYGIDEKYQGLTPIESQGLEARMYDPKETEKLYDVTKVADDEGANKIAQDVYDMEVARTGSMPQVNYDQTLTEAGDKYVAVKSKNKFLDADKAIQEKIKPDEEFLPLNKRMEKNKKMSLVGKDIDPGEAKDERMEPWRKRAMEAIEKAKSGLTPGPSPAERGTATGTDEPATASPNTGQERFSLSLEDDKRPTFYSNAERAVENVKQEKATAEQWKAMLTKAGGIKAGEDKWMGLSAWLDENKGKSLTKAEVLQFIADNGVKMEEVEYVDRPLSLVANGWKNGNPTWVVENHPEYTIELWGNDYIDIYKVYKNGKEYSRSFSNLGDAERMIAKKLKLKHEINVTRATYTTRGLENNREIAFVVPDVEPYQENDAIHFGPENQGKAVMWVRFGETKDADGKRVLVIDEVQSNRHQEGREKGYSKKYSKEEYDAVMAEYKAVSEKMKAKYGAGVMYNYDHWEEITPQDKEEIRAISEKHADATGSRLMQKPPEAPFEKNWHEVAMKRMLRYAAENGYDKVAWTTGEQQARRYDIGNMVEDLFYKKNADGTYNVSVVTKDSRGHGAGRYTDYGEQSFPNQSEADLVKLLGKEVTQKIVEGKGRKGFTHNGEKDWYSFKGKDLYVGGEGMKSFYDGMLPQFMNKYGKKWGVKTGTVELPLVEKAGQTMHSVDVTPEMKESVMQGQPLFSLAGDALENSSAADAVEVAKGVRKDARREVYEKLRGFIESEGGEPLDFEKAGQVSRLIGAAMRGQKEYDQATVKAVSRFVQDMLKSGLLDGMTETMVGQALRNVERATGKENVTKEVNALMDMMLKHQVRTGKAEFNKLLKTKGRKVDSGGVEVMAGLDESGARQLDALKSGLDMLPETLDEKISEAADKMINGNDLEKANAKDRLAGLQLAKNHFDWIKANEAEEAELREQMNDAEMRYKTGGMTAEELKDFRRDYEETMRRIMLERADGYNLLNSLIKGGISESAQRAKAWREADAKRKEDIIHDANRDMQGISADPHMQKKWFARMKDKVAVGLQLFTAPLPTFANYFRYFGKKFANGEGNLYNRFVRGAVRAADASWKGFKEGMDEMDAKVSEVFGKKMKWTDLYFEGAKRSINVNMHGNTYTISQGGAVYIYMANKQADGRMKLRYMGIDDAQVERIKGQVDPRLIEIADWLQKDFLPAKRVKYNEVYKRIYGTDMAEIDNYFPLVINELDVAKKDQLQQGGINKVSAKASAIFARKHNNAALDITRVDAFSVAVQHLMEMEHWAAHGELARDLNTLLCSKRFETQVNNSTSLRYGPGDERYKKFSMWNDFVKCCQIVTGDYNNEVGKASATFSKITSNWASANISFRFYTAAKQLLSSPVFLTQAQWHYLIKDGFMAVGTWNWAIKNLPMFAERWQSRRAGDPILDDLDISAGGPNRVKNLLKAAQRVGMSPNAFIDAMTVATGARAIYETKKKKYINAGYKEDVAEQRALEDAAISVNESQQSSQGAFVSSMQRDRDAWSRFVTVYRNASMGYQRKLMQGCIDFGHFAFTPGWIPECKRVTMDMAKRDGLSDEQAEKVANRAVAKAFFSGLANVVMFGSIAPATWSLGSQYLPMLITGTGSEDDRESAVKSAVIHALSGWIEGMQGGGTYGDIIQFLYDKKWKGDDSKKWKYVTISNDPVLSSLEKTIGKLDGKKYIEAYYEAGNLLFSSLVGVNPNTATRWVAGIMESLDGNIKDIHEFGILLGAILNAPQSALDKAYFDVLMLPGRNIRNYTPEELAKRYAKYKRYKNVGWFNAFTTKEEDEALEDAYVEKYTKELKERMKTMSAEEIEKLGNEQLSEMKEGVDEQAAKTEKTNARKERNAEIDKYTEAQLDSAYAVTPGKADRQRMRDVAEELYLDKEEKAAKKAAKKTDDNQEDSYYYRGQTKDDLKVDTHVENRFYVLNNTVAYEFRKLGAERSKNSRKPGWVAPAGSSAEAIKKMKEYKAAHQAELDEWEELNKLSNYRKNWNDKLKKASDEAVRKDYREKRDAYLKKYPIK